MDAPTDPGTPSGGHWTCRSIDPSGRWLTQTIVRSALHPDRTLVELSPDAARRAIGTDAVVTATFDAERAVTGLALTPLGAPNAPPLWFAELRESAAHPPAVHLVAFTGHGVRVGALLDQSRLAETDVEAADQLGALRWYPATGEVDQIYVQPEWRRRGIARALTLASASLNRARGWPQLWGDGQRTELGEQWRTAQPWRDRAAPLTHIAPPMTPSSSSPPSPPAD